MKTSVAKRYLSKALALSREHPQFWKLTGGKTLEESAADRASNPNSLWDKVEALRTAVGKIVAMYQTVRNEQHSGWSEE